MDHDARTYEHFIFCLLLVLFFIIRLDFFASRSACAVCTDMAVDRDFFLFCASFPHLYFCTEDEG